MPFPSSSPDWQWPSRGDNFCNRLHDIYHSVSRTAWHLAEAGKCSCLVRDKNVCKATAKLREHRGLHNSTLIYRDSLPLEGENICFWGWTRAPSEIWPIWEQPQGIHPMAATGLFFWQLSPLSVIWVLCCWKEDELVVNKCLFLSFWASRTPQVAGLKYPFQPWKTVFQKHTHPVFFYHEQFQRKLCQLGLVAFGGQSLLCCIFLLSISKKRRKERKKET